MESYQSTQTASWCTFQTNSKINAWLEELTLLQQPRLNVYTAADFEEKAYPAMTVTFQPKGYPSFFQPDHHDIADVGLFQDLLQGITCRGEELD